MKPLHTQPPRSPLDARLPLPDRRSLSEAWYSALHVAERERPGFTRARGGFAATRNESLAAAHGKARAPQEALAIRPAAGARAGSPRVAVDAAGRLARSGRTMPVLRNAPARCAVPARSRFTITVGGARVHVLLKRTGGGVRVVAICAGSVERAVRRALVASVSRSGSVRCDVVGLERVR
jgi:hypothetical protein